MTAETHPVLVVNNAEDEVHDFVRPIQDLLAAAQVSCQVISYKQLTRTIVLRYRAVILSASPLGNDIVEHHQVYYRWLLTHWGPVLGICAGHQIIGRLFGGELRRSVESEVGLSTVRVLCPDPLLKGLAREFTVLQHHNDSVTCPSEFVVLASSARCENQIMRHRARPIYSTQFHAERSGVEIITNFLSLALLHMEFCW
ncbi:MAG: hypothetical protein JSW71_21770 [Gemmatimonadota bacterium]|nr:MAG: hypothetical protein JSW71_21770 [Gemmatimonadota bacterium]